MSVYRLYDAGGTLLYVGISGGAVRRFEAHRRATDWWPSVARARIEHYPTRAAALAREAALIDAERPRYNVIAPLFGPGAGATGDGVHHVPLRLPTDVYERVRREAAARERSANWVMVRLLRRSLDESPEWLARALE